MLELKNVNSKSFINYTLDKPLNKINVFFGQNGSGKSALSSWIKSQDSDHTQVFDTAYVDKNIRQTSTISGTSLTIGKEQIDRKESITQANTIIDNLERANTQYEIQAESKQLFSEMDKAIALAKENFETTNIKQKANAKQDPLNALRLWHDEIGKYKNISSDFSSAADITSAMEKCTRIINRLTPILASWDSSKRAKVISSMGKVVLQPKTAVSNMVIKWLEQGESLHDFSNSEDIATQKCLFCGNDFSVGTVRASISERIDSEYAELITELSSYTDELNESLSTLKTLPIDEIPSDKVDSAKESIKSFIQAVHTKLIEPERTIKIDKTAFIDIDFLNKKINNSLQDVEKQRSQYQQELNNLENVTKQYVGKLLEDNPIIARTKSRLELLLANKRYEDDSLELTNQYLVQQKSHDNDLSGFKTLMNSILKSLGLDFFIEFNHSIPSTFDVVLNHDKSRLSIHELSEGEIRLIGFIHFYLSLFSEYRVDDSPENVSTTISAETQSVILDDPITSVDSNNRYFMTSLINSFIQAAVSSHVVIYVFTHSLFDFHNFAYHSSADTTRYRITKDVIGHSEITPLSKQSLRNYSDDYHSSFQEVANFCLLGRSKLTEDIHFLHFGNQCRFILETHARSNYNIENVTTNSLPKLIRVYDIPGSASQSFSGALDVINSLSHGMSYSWDYVSQISPTEIQKAARLILWILFHKDPQHVQAMTGDVPRFCRSVAQWAPSNPDAV